MNTPRGILWSALLAALACRGCMSRPCEHRAGTPPPCTTLQLDAAGGDRSVIRGQGVRVGNRVLTAAHVLLREGPGGGAALADAFLLEGEPARVVSARSGDLTTVAHLYAVAAPPRPADWLEDWAALEVSCAMPPVGRMRIGDGRVRVGERLYVVGVDPRDDEGRVRAVPITVVEAVLRGADDETLPDRLIPVSSPAREDWRGWSGAFVGRYDAERGEWEYVGQFVMSVENSSGRRVHLVLRPPPDVLAWLMSP